ncbi:MAG: Asp-tRNA(Asn)/Glu-tRNA(Gln) amidotransferase subunit GatB [Burkholderiales bacterium]
MAWEIVVGIETHAQLRTRSKMFSGAATDFGAPPNAQACAVDIALPGVLPVVNAAAVELAVKFGLAVGGRINTRSVFARKNYFYPDLPKGYQISQYEIPIVQGGAVQFLVDAKPKTIQLTRAHLEEDAGKSLHEDFRGMTGIDLNRAGTPLLEIVSEPELRGAKEAVAYARALHALVRWIGICDGNMQEGSFRCDANVSVRRAGSEQLGTRSEIKNLNSFRFMEEAIEFEARRQIELLEGGGTVLQETRLYDSEKGETRSMRTKEDAHDYRYFPDPDLLPLVVKDADIERIRATMPKSLEEQRRDFESRGVPTHIAALLTSNPTGKTKVIAEADAILTQYKFTPEKHAQILASTANAVVSSATAKLEDWGSSQFLMPDLPRELVQIQVRVLDGEISSKQAKEVQDAILAGEGTTDEVIEKRGLKQMSDTGALEKIVDEVLAQNAKQVEDYRAGKDKAFNSLVGQVMKATQGKANPAQVNRLLKAKLGG